MPMARIAAIGRRGLRAAALLALVSLALPAQAEQVALSRAELRDKVAQLIFTGHAARALPFAEALVADDPEDFGALLLAAYAARDAGQAKRSAELARAAWQKAEGEDQKHAAAMAMAQAKSSGGARTSAQLWLRRAIEHAPDAKARKMALRDYKYVRARNPWSYRFDLGVAPSSNINGGAASDTIWLFGLPFTLSGDSQALSGVETRMSLSVERTVQESPAAKSTIGVNMGGRAYQLSSEARDLAPNARGSDYAFAAVEAFATHRRKAGQGGEWDSRLTFGHNEYGGEALSNYLRFDGGRTVMLKGGQEMRFGLLVEDQHRLDADKNSALVRGINLDWSRPLGAGTARLGARLTDVAADAVEIAHVSRGVSLGYDFAKPVLGANLSVSVGYEERDYGAIWTVPEGRADERVSVDARAHLRQLDYMGFAPEVGVNYTRNRSNSVLHDSREMGLSLGIKSTF
ncbi:hypothetical protein CLN94_13300 [Pseudothioclava arenosa]|uniref:DUF560 domain-containing protein n=2 Tax=Pseudothioclava arenosa TaxID=1795308 RepID=A0A2A4CMX8_9RHOB|nr:hypothetical protein CLN94_13300 [Pseudothioclava arenosa]